MIDGFYRAFEERYYAPREVIKKLRRQYLPFTKFVSSLYPGAETYDLGCGRGEWLELMLESGMRPFGVDLDAGMLQGCLERGLSAEQGDAVAYLSTLPDDSQAIVSAFHVVEHISFEQLRTVVSEALRVLKPGGLLIMETPNPENIAVATRNFYLDPTHQRPIPPLLLSFLPEYYGFARTKILRLQESRELAEKASPTLIDVLDGASPDYAVVAQKAAPASVLEAFTQEFNKEYGLSLSVIAARYDAALGFKVQQAGDQAQQALMGFDKAAARVQQAEVRCQQAEYRVQQVEERCQEAEVRVQQAEARCQQVEARVQQAEALSQQAEARARQAEALLGATLESTSWRITAPIRWVRSGANCFSPNALRPQVSLLLQHAKLYVRRRPRLKGAALSLLNRFPELKLVLLRATSSTVSSSVFPVAPVESRLTALTPRARQIYADLKTAIENEKRK